MPFYSQNYPCMTGNSWLGPEESIDTTGIFPHRRFQHVQQMSSIHQSWAVRVQSKPFRQQVYKSVCQVHIPHGICHGGTENWQGSESKWSSVADMNALISNLKFVWFKILSGLLMAPDETTIKIYASRVFRHAEILSLVICHPNINKIFFGLAILLGGLRNKVKLEASAKQPIGELQELKCPKQPQIRLWRHAKLGIMQYWRIKNKTITLNCLYSPTGKFRCREREKENILMVLVEYGARHNICRSVQFLPHVVQFLTRVKLRLGNTSFTINFLERFLETIRGSVPYVLRSDFTFRTLQPVSNPQIKRSKKWPRLNIWTQMFLFIYSLHLWSICSSFFLNIIQSIAVQSKQHQANSKMSALHFLQVFRTHGRMHHFKWY